MCDEELLISIANVTFGKPRSENSEINKVIDLNEHRRRRDSGFHQAPFVQFSAKAFTLVRHAAD
jgi:hypothetical protein